MREPRIDLALRLHLHGAVALIRGVVLGCLVVASCGLAPADARWPSYSCEVRWGCDSIVNVASAQVGIPLGATVRVVEAEGLGLPMRSSGDLGVVVVLAPDNALTLILVGMVGINPEPQAWVLDPTTQADLYERFRLNGQAP